MILFINIAILLIICLTLTVTLFFNAALQEKDEDGEGPAKVGFVFFILFISVLTIGLWYYANEPEKIIITEIKPLEILKSNSKAYLEFDIGTDDIFYLDFSEKIDYDEIDSATFYKIENIDYYGNFIEYEISKSVKYKNMPKSKPLLIRNYK